jgi:hypothetical protein
MSNTLPRTNIGSHFEERAMIAQLEEENNEMLREMAALEQQQLLADSSGHLLGLRDRTVDLETKMREKQQIRRQLIQQLEHLMLKLNVHFFIAIKTRKNN